MNPGGQHKGILIYKISNFTTPFSIQIFTVLIEGSAAETKVLMHKVLSANFKAGYIL